MAKVSVIVPVYGVEKYLREAIDSVLNQTLTDLEIILIDDGGKDNCPAIIDEYAQNDSRIIAIHKQNGGYGQTCNLGLSKATGEYIAILEPDDYIDSKMYEELYKIAKEHNSDIVKSCFYDNLQCDRLKRVKKVKWNDYIPEDKSFTIKEYPYFLYYHPSIWTCIYKKEFLDKHNIRFVEAPGAGWTDNPFQVQTMCLAERINYTSNAYYYWRRLNYFDSDEDVMAENEKYARLWNVRTFSMFKEDDIKSSGYVVDALEAAIWCFLNTDNYKDCVLKAVNLGGDTDTIGAVAGGLAGVYYGMEEIPEEWLRLLPKKEWIVELVEKMFERKKEFYV